MPMWVQVNLLYNTRAISSHRHVRAPSISSLNSDLCQTDPNNMRKEKTPRLLHTKFVAYLRSVSRKVVLDALEVCKACVSYKHIPSARFLE